MITRRNFSAAIALSPALLLAPSVRAHAAEVNDDGLHVQPFFLNTFLDMREDKAEADAAGKHLAVFFEQRGCPYCREMHEVNLARPEISEFVAGTIACLQLNLFGSRDVTDFDGPVMEVHISNIHKREEFRHQSFVSARAEGVIAGLGTEGYKAAVRRLAQLLA